MVGIHGERAFEDAIEASLTTGGYTAGVNAHFDSTLGLDTAVLFEFVGATQGETWERLVALRGGRDEAQRGFAERLAAQLDARGTVDVLRHGVDDLGVHLDLAYFRPASGINPDLEAAYQTNRLTLVRQLRYSAKRPDLSVDLALFVNGVPVATAELKNPLTGQRVEHAVAQYRTDRDPADRTLGKRCVVHFAVDPDRVLMTTRLAGARTRFLPFDQGTGGPGQDGGAGNPPARDGAYATSYLWEQVWARDAWLDILGRFVHTEYEHTGKRGKATRGAGSVIFPRYHQWHVVRALEAEARTSGAGYRYLVQHSAGSGKSNTIAWLAHRLASLHAADDSKVFDKVIVVTDRRVLDAQLQETVHQFEHTVGVVARIDENSAQLADALTSTQAKIIITTLQKFPFVSATVASLPESRYALLVDEAHSSQTGEAAKEMKEALGGGADSSMDEGEELDAETLLAQAVEASAKARGPQDNLSIFAFTATPKPKTLEIFGRRGVGPDGGAAYEPHHLYSMRQAIEEGFILDVLAAYTPYETYFRLTHDAVDDPEVERRKAAAEIARYVTLHPQVMSQKARIVVDHVRAHTMREIAGKGKAMVVCSSRLHAVRMKIAIESYLAEQGWVDLGVLVAFSGTVTDPDTGAELTEARMNGFGESQTAARFSDPDNRILVVAEKFQTGFDQPLLHTMFVDKRLVGVNAVQTLSRLNRTHPEKTSTFVLDFVNDAGSIEEAFAPYYARTMAAPTDPNALFDARRAMLDFGVVDERDVGGFATVWFGGGRADEKDAALHARLYGFLQPTVDRFVDLDEEDQDAFRSAVRRFVHLYAFLSQVLPLADTATEKLYAYARLLALRLPGRDGGPPVDLDIELTHLRVVSAGSRAIDLDPSGEVLPPAFTGDGTGPAYLPGMEPLSEIIQRFNDTYGVNLTEADALHLVGVLSDVAADPVLQQQAAANTMDSFAAPFKDAFESKVVGRMKSAEDLTYKILDNVDGLRDEVVAWMQPQAYERAKVAWQKSCPIGDLLRAGEGQHLEYKSTLRWDLKLGEKSKVLEGVVVKTVAGFLNSRFGGTVLIGVADDGSVVGLEHDYATLHKQGKDDADLFQLHLTQVVSAAVGLAAAANVTTQVHAVNGGSVCRVHVEPSGHPVMAKVTTSAGPAEQFFVRTNNATKPIDDQTEQQLYVRQRWVTTRGWEGNGDRRGAA